MHMLRQAIAVFTISLKRLFAQRRLALLTTLGLTVAVALTLSVPLYADAIYGRTLGGMLLDREAKSEYRPPFAMLFRHIASPGLPAEWANIQAADRYFSVGAASDLGLPCNLRVRFLKTGYLGLFPSGTDTEYFTIRNQLGLVNIGAAGAFADHVAMIEGRFPDTEAALDGNPIEVAASEDMASRTGLQVGETYVLFDNEMGPGRSPVQIPVRISGVWRPLDEQDEYWFYQPWALADVFMVPESVFTSTIMPYLRDPISLSLWYLVFDGSGVRPTDAQSYLTRISGVSQQAAQLVPGIMLAHSPADVLARYEKAATVLTVLLYAFSVPILGLILAFIALVVKLTVGQQRNEIAVLRSRGGSALQVVGIAALEALIVNVVALALGWPLGEVFARAIGRTRSFLNFSAAADVHVQMAPSIMRLGLVAAAIALVTQLVPTLGAARHTVVTYKAEQARTLRAPWWQRAWLDLLLLIPTGYGLYLLRKQGTLVALPLSQQSAAGDPFQNPLLFLIPTLSVFALSLVILRIMPLAMRAIVWLASRTRSVALLLATRHLARTPGYYAAPVLLLVMTLSLSGFTASLAQTLDSHLYDQAYYEVGADMVVDELGQDRKFTFATEYVGPGQAASSSSGDAGPRWLFLPVAEHLKVSGVEMAARVGRYPATALWGGQSTAGTFIGLDRVDFPRVAFWRGDFASLSLGSLMNGLATVPDGILVSSAFMAENSLALGDTVRVKSSSYGGGMEARFTIVGDFELFPTWYPDDGPLFVGNLDNYFEQIGGQAPYAVWLKSGSTRDYERIADDVEALGVTVIDWDAPLLRIAEEQRRPERQGLFGVLSVGFIAAALLTVLGFLLYALFSLRRRSIELGILRAVGLPVGQMSAFLAWELALLILTGVAPATALGVWISRLFIPYLQIGPESVAQVPPFLVEIAWPAIFRIYALVGLLFVVALVLLVFVLRRMKIFQAIKLGETL